MAPNVALLGSGTFAKASYLPALLALQGNTVNLHTIWSRSSSSAESLLSAAQEQDASLKPVLKHGDEGLEAVLADKEVEGVMIVLPITTQPDIVRRAWKAGKHVISEKPLAKDVKDALALIEEYETVYKPKGLIWRVAENYAHEPMLREAGKLLASTPELGPILYWQLRFEAFVEDGSKYHKTGWRTIPDYQGGFLLDGGVHWLALLRVVLPDSALPSSVLAISHMHRAHLLPHDTVLALSLPPASSEVPPHGDKTKLTSAERKEHEVPGEMGKSSPTGQILCSFGSPELPLENKVPNGLTITCLNGIVTILSNPANRDWQLEVVPSTTSQAKPFTKTGPGEGVEVELRMFGQAIQAIKDGKDVGEDYGTPRDALWDLTVMQALLTSKGEKVSVDSLLKGE
ncbi:hypothetical protein IAU60_004488 [Kwoniella sp. DSM 27419]